MCLDPNSEIFQLGLEILFANLRTLNTGLALRLHIEKKQWSFPLIQSSFVRLTQLAQFDENQSCMEIHASGDCLRHRW